VQLVYKRKKANDLSERQKRRCRQMQIKTAKMNIITNGNYNNDHLSEDRINQTCNEHVVAISKNNKSETITNIATECILEANESTNTVDDNDKHSYNHKYYTSSSDSDITETDNYSDSNSDRNDFSIEKENIIARPEKELTFVEKLADSCSRTNMNHVQINSILSVLRQHKCLARLPKDARSLLKTPRHRIIPRTVHPGEYIHIGIKSNILNMLSKTADTDIPSTILFDFSTDGANIYKNVQYDIYPIQFRIPNIPDRSPMIAGLYAGKKKPADFVDFFKDFNEELLGIIREGISYKNRKIKLEIRCFIADTPARTDYLNIVGHTGFNSCHKCKIPCERRKTDSSVIFKGENYPPRSDNDFRQLKHPEHQRGKSAVNSLPLGPVSQTPHDYMHLVCLGLMKKIFEALIEGKFQPKKLLPEVISRISSRLITLAEYCPKEFSRKPRSLDYLHRFKATEYRQFLLYTGPTIMLDLFGEDKRMKHFLKLHYAIQILVSLNERSISEINMAEDILRKFVSESVDIYGRRFLSYNTHGLLHLANDARNFGPLDHFSCFPFENNMTFFRKMVRKSS